MLLSYRTGGTESYRSKPSYRRNFMSSSTLLRPTRCWHWQIAPSEREALQNAVFTGDQQIDQLVYELYGLTLEEIQFVEGTN